MLTCQGNGVEATAWSRYSESDTAAGPVDLFQQIAAE